MTSTYSEFSTKHSCLTSLNWTNGYTSHLWKENATWHSFLKSALCMYFMIFQEDDPDVILGIHAHNYPQHYSLLMTAQHF